MRFHLLLLVGVVHMDVALSVVLQVPIGRSVVGAVVRVPIRIGVQGREGACLLRPSCCNVVRWRSLLQPI